MRTRHLIPFILLVAACDRTETITAPRSDDSLTKPATVLFARSASRLGAPLGLTGCWSGDGNATDVVFANSGSVLGSVSYAKGKIGQAFSFNGVGGDVLIAQSPTLDVMQGDGITLAAWFKPKGQAFGNVAGSGPILEYDNGAQLWQHSQIEEDPSTTFFTNMSFSDQDWHILEAPFTVTQNAWNHGVATYSKTSGNITAYVNGTQVAQTHVGVINPRTAAPFHIGSRQPGSFGATRYTFNGIIDEAQVYNRELTPAEVAQIASATTTLCTTPSQIAILTQPAGAESGAPFATQPTVQLLDASGVPVTYARTAVTVTIASGASTLLGTTTVNGVNGIATFLNLGIVGPGPVTLRFTAVLPTGSPSVTSANFTIRPAPPYSWSGFFGDVAAPPQLNRAKAGKEIDLEFGVGGDIGSSIFAAGSPASRPISCKTLMSLGGLVPVVMSRDHVDGEHGDGEHGDDDHGGDKNKDKDSSRLSYNGKNLHYTLEWQTGKSFDDSCRALVLTLADGSTHTAYFSFSK